MVETVIESYFCLTDNLQSIPLTPALGCERTGSDNASDKRQNCRLSQQRTHEIKKI